MKKNKRYLKFILTIPLLIGMALFMPSCVDVISLETTGNVRLITIDGTISSEEGPYVVRFFYSGEFSTDQEGQLTPIIIRNGRVVGDNGETSELEFVEDGIYQTSDLSFRGKEGVNYHIEFESNEGSNYASRPQLLLPAIPIDEISFDVFKDDVVVGDLVSIEKTFVQFNADFQVSSIDEEAFMKWDFTGEYLFEEIPDNRLPIDVIQKCYVKDRIGFNKIAILDGSTILGQPFSFEDVVTLEADYKFNRVYCFHLLQQTITQESYEYWENIKSLAERSGSLFEVAPGIVSGNVFNVNDPEEQVLGMFYTVGTSSKRLFVTSHDTNTFERLCDFATSPPETFCIDCTSILNSTLEKPLYWND